MYTSFHGVQIDRPRWNDRATENTTIQMTYHRYVSRKNRMRSMTYMIASANGTWLLHRAAPKYLSLQFKTFVRAMTATGLLKFDVKKKYDSVNLQPKISSQSESDAMRALRVRSGYEAVKVWEAMYLRDLPATRSPNKRPEGTILNATVTTTERKNCAIPMIRGMLPWPGRSSTSAM